MTKTDFRGLVCALLFFYITVSYAKPKQSNSMLNQGNVVVTVGPNSGCDFYQGNFRIQDAIGSGADEVRIVRDVNNPYVESLLIDISVGSVVIKGGYDTCFNAEFGTQNLDHTTIHGLANDPVVKITGQVPLVRLENLFLRDGHDNGFYTAGGISMLNVNGNLSLKDVLIGFNSGSLGGGLSVVGGQANVYIQDTNIYFNEANQGGGVYCSGASNSVSFTNGSNINSGVFQNSATVGDGGAALITDGCSFSSNMGNGAGGATFDLRGFENNSAAGHGGALAITEGASAVLHSSGAYNTPSSFYNNTASGDGGAVYVSGEDSSIEMSDVYFKGNQAQNGGAIAALEGSTVQVMQGSDSCWSPGSCNQFAENSANTYGGVFYGNITDTLPPAIVVLNSHIYGNSSGSYGSVLNLRGQGAYFYSIGLNVYENVGSQVVFYNYIGTLAGYSFITAADNQPTQSVFRSFQSDTFALGAAIVHEQDDQIPVYTSSETTTETLTCLLVSNDTNLFDLEVGQDPMVADPLFVDRANDDYHINAATSPAVDFCQDLGVTGVDIDGEGRVWDDPDVADLYGPMDVGADETYDNDIIFKNGFD